MTMYRVTRYAPRARMAVFRENIGIQAEADSRSKLIEFDSYRLGIPIAIEAGSLKFLILETAASGETGC
jgi:hypothetical protein